jgi:hypothetical protein
VGFVEHGTVKVPRTQAENLDSFAWHQQNAPPVEFLGWNTEPEKGPAWLQVTDHHIDVIGPVETLILVSGATYLLITMRSSEALPDVCIALGRGESNR